MPNTGPSYLKSLAAASASDDARLDVAEQREMVKEEFLTNGALTKTSGMKVLTKGSVGAYTLAAPTAAEEGAEVFITSDTAFAHVVTATGLIRNGVTGGDKNTLTFAAFAGAGCTLVARNLKWNVKSLQNVTVG